MSCGPDSRQRVIAVGTRRGRRRRTMSCEPDCALPPAAVARMPAAVVHKAHDVVNNPQTRSKCQSQREHDSLWLTISCQRRRMRTRTTRLRTSATRKVLNHCRRKLRATCARCRGRNRRLLTGGRRPAGIPYHRPRRQYSLVRGAVDPDPARAVSDPSENGVVREEMLLQVPDASRDCQGDHHAQVPRHDDRPRSSLYENGPTPWRGADEEESAEHRGIGVHRMQPRRIGGRFRDDGVVNEGGPRQRRPR